MPRGWCYRLAIRFAISKGIQNSKLPSARSYDARRDGVTDPIELREWALEGLLLR